MDRIRLVEDLARDEPEAAIGTLAMMAYNPAIGRVLERDGVGMFRNPYRGRRAWAFGSRDDVFHSETCERIIRTFKTNRIGIAFRR